MTILWLFFYVIYIFLFGHNTFGVHLLTVLYLKPSYRKLLIKRFQYIHTDMPEQTVLTQIRCCDLWSTLFFSHPTVFRHSQQVVRYACVRTSMVRSFGYLIHLTCFFIIFTREITFANFHLLSYTSNSFWKRWTPLKVDSYSKEVKINFASCLPWKCNHSLRCGNI